MTNFKSYEYNKEYIKRSHAKMENIVVRVPKGQKAVIQRHAAARGESVNAFVQRLIKEDMGQSR